MLEGPLRATNWLGGEGSLEGSLEAPPRATHRLGGGRGALWEGPPSRCVAWGGGCRGRAPRATHRLGGPSHNAPLPPPSRCVAWGGKGGCGRASQADVRLGGPKETCGGVQPHDSSGGACAGKGTHKVSSSMDGSVDGGNMDGGMVGIGQWW